MFVINVYSYNFLHLIKINKTLMFCIHVYIKIFMCEDKILMMSP